MAIISDFDEEEHHTQPSSSTGIHDADEQALLQILSRKGPLPFFETVVNLLRLRSDIFKTESSVSKLMAVLSAAKQKEFIEQTAVNEKTDKEPLLENVASIAKTDVKEKAIDKMDVDETKENTSMKPDQVNGGGDKEAATVMTLM